MIPLWIHGLELRSMVEDDEGGDDVKGLVYSVNELYQIWVIIRNH